MISRSAQERHALPAALLLKISQLDERLKELDEERAELAQYQALDKRKRSLQYAILDQELRSIKAELEKVREGKGGEGGKQGGG